MKDKVILFGAGFYGREAFDGLKDKYEILCFADNNPVLSNTYLLGIPVIPAERILEYKKEDADIVVCTESYTQIGKQLKEMGISSYYIMLEGCYDNS